MAEIGYPMDGPTGVYEDNKATKDIVDNPRCHAKLRHVDLKQHMPRQAREEGHIVIVKVSSADEIADVMTKSLSRELH